MTEIVIAEDQADELGELAEHNAAVSEGAAAVHQAAAEAHAQEATESASIAQTAAESGVAAAEVAEEGAVAATEAASEVGALIAAHTDAMREQTSAISSLVAEMRENRTSATPPVPVDSAPSKPKADRPPRAGGKRVRSWYFGGGGG